MPESTTKETTMKKAEVAAMFRVSPRTVENWVKAGLLRQIKIGTCVRFNTEEVWALAKGQKESAQ